jgi:hypothetical protein
VVDVRCAAHSGLKVGHRGMSEKCCQERTLKCTSPLLGTSFFRCVESNNPLALTCWIATTWPLLRTV